MKPLYLFHTGLQIIREPDIRYGRKNADFGQGFYLSDNEAFSKRWARERMGASAYLNGYQLELEGLKVKRFDRSVQWFDYICANRAYRPDSLAEYDVIIGPIANDTIYDTWGVVTSGLLKREQALQLLMIGPEYVQTVVKTDAAASALRFMGALRLSAEEVSAYRETVRKEEAAFQLLFAQKLASFEPGAD